MHNFTYSNPTKIIFGEGSIAKISAEIPEHSRIMLTYGGGSIRKNGVLKQVKEALKGFEIFEFGGIEPNPEYETLLKCVDQIQAKRCTFILAVGGGSVIDGTKFIAAASLFEGDPWEIVSSFGFVVKEALPFGTVLTLPATGSEMNNGSVISRREIKTKLPFSAESTFPRFSALDPTTTYSLPQRQISNGIVDTFVHVMEQYMTYPVEAHVQDRFAEGLLKSLIEDGPRALQEPQNYDLRANLMWCATLGLNGLIGAGVPQDWSTHMVGHELTALHGLDHAQTLAIILPSMLEVRKIQKRDKLLQYGQRVWDIAGGSEEQRIDKAIAKTRAFFEELQVKTRLSDYGINASSIPVLIEQIKAHGMTQLGEKHEVTPKVVEQVLEASL